jgi:hypothetical protein
MTHLMEVSSTFFEEVKNGTKNFVLVKYERPYEDGDKLVLQEVGEDKKHTKSELALKIKVVEKATTGLKSDYCILSFEINI